MKSEPYDIDKLLAGFESHGDPSLNPTREQLIQLAQSQFDGPLQMVNLLAFHETANYPADHASAGEETSGLDAYNRYGAVALAQVSKRGGRLFTINAVEQTVIGSSHWDQIGIMEYPKAEAFLDMIQDPEYTAALVHRDAGLKATEIFLTRALIDKPLSLQPIFARAKNA